MDANGSKFHLLRGEADWPDWLAAGPSEGLVFDAESGSLALRPLVDRIRPTPGEAALRPEDRRGADCDRFGHWYWIGEDRRSIRVRSCGAAAAEPFWDLDRLTKSLCPPSGEGLFRPVGPPAEAPWPAMRLSGLAVTDRHYLVAGTLDPGGLLVFDLHAGGPPQFQVWPEEISFEPFDIAPAWGGGAWILDRGGQGLGGRYWRLDAWLRPVPAAGEIELAPAVADEFGPEGGEPTVVGARTFPAAFSLAFASPVEAEAPRAILGLPDGSVLILDTPDDATFSRVLRRRGDRAAGDIALEAALFGDLLEGAAEVRGHDFAFVPGAPTAPGAVGGRLYVGAVDGNQAFAFDLEADGDRFELRFRPERLPIRRWSGKALGCCKGSPHYDLDERWLPLAAHPRRRYIETASGSGWAFDGKLPGCLWRRLILDGCLPDGAAVTVESRAADDRAALRQELWRAEPAPYRRAEGSEVPFHDPFPAERAAGAGTWETVLQGARGRYLELRLTLAGDGRSTPRIQALRVYYPVFSYLERYLPAVYREDPVAASFLDRYLTNTEGLLTALEGRIAAAEGLLDSRIAPVGYLDWLAGWFGTTLDPDWESERRRLFLAYAELLYRWRGTPAGLLAMIRLAIDPCPSEAIFADLLAGRLPSEERYAGASVRLVERFLTRGFAGVSLGDPTAPPSPGLGSASEWTPAQGAEPLHTRFRVWLQAKYAPGGTPEDALNALSAAWEQAFAESGQVRLSPVVPAQAAKAVDWREFLRAGLGFRYAEIGAADAAFYRTYLERRWGRVEEMNAAYGSSTAASFAAVALPSENDFPSSGSRLHDWIGFASLAVPVRETAHRFTLLIPADPTESAAVRERRVAVARAVAAREKPAHTDFEVVPYWALFQVGTARLGLDTALGEGARYTAIELDRTALGEGFLAHGHPWNVIDRAVLGRDAVAEIRT